MATILDKIVDCKRDEIARTRASRSASELQAALADAPPIRDFFAPLAAGGPVKLIAEIKKASPSAGVIPVIFNEAALSAGFGSSIPLGLEIQKSIVLLPS